ncbi:MAG: TIGR03667 family PPOX class F420-dependent oxidoreductase [Pseudonocardiales bacterium]
MANDVLPDASSAFGRRVRERVRDDLLVWFTTVGADGSPQPNPVWFIWVEPSTVLTYNMATAARLAHIARNPRVSLNFDGDGQGGDIIVLTGRAELAPQSPAPHENPEYLAKYGEPMTQVSGSPEAFSAAYPVAVTIALDRVRGH